MNKPLVEFEQPEKIKAFQNRKLKELLNYVNEKSPYYQRYFEKHNISPEEIQGVDDLSKLPFTTKDQLAKHNDEFLCVDKNKIADFVTTSGTLGDPVTFYLTSKDVDRLAYNEAISLQCANGSENDIYQLMTTIDKRFMAGLAYTMGVQKLDAGIIRVGPGAAFLQWDSILRFSPTVLIAIPSFIPKLIEYAKEHNIDYKNSSVKSVVCIGEPIRKADLTLNELGEKILSEWDIKLYSTYASTEMGAAFTECEHGNGGHLHPELLILEVIDDEGNQVKNGEIGEVVVTTLGVEGMPLLRYKTGDLCHVYYDKCLCNRTTTRLGPIIGRKQQMIKYKGTTIYPPAIFDVLDSLGGVEVYQIEVSKNEYGYDDINILLPESLSTKPFIHELNSLFSSRLRVKPSFRFVPVEDLIKKVYDPNKRKPEKIIYTA